MFAIALAVATVAWTGWKALIILFTEDLYCDRGSFEYYVAIHSGLIKQTPLVQLQGSPRFYASCGDGPKPPANGISYTSNANAEAVKSRLTDYILNDGYVRGDDRTGSGGTVFVRGRGGVELFVSAEGATRTEVRIYEWYGN